jgi:hypothetical protein
MTECRKATGCIFFVNRLSSMPNTAELMRKKYCDGDNKSCARYMVCKTLGLENVPPDLFPNQRERALDIISGLGS